MNAWQRERRSVTSTHFSIPAGWAWHAFLHLLTAMVCSATAWYSNLLLQPCDYETTRAVISWTTAVNRRKQSPGAPLLVHAVSDSPLLAPHYDYTFLGGVYPWAVTSAIVKRAVVHARVSRARASTGKARAHGAHHADA